MMSPARYAVAATLGILAWLTWLIGGLSVASWIGHETGLPFGIATGVLVLVVAIGVPTFIVTRALDRASRGL